MVYYAIVSMKKKTDETGITNEMIEKYRSARSVYFLDLDKSRKQLLLDDIQEL